MYIKKSDVAEIRERVNILDVVSQFVSLKQAGVCSYKGLCPFHDEKTPSFFIQTSSGFYHCFGCGESGDVYQFLQKIEHCSFADAVRKLAQSINYEIRYEKGPESADQSVQRIRILEANKLAAEFFQENLWGQNATHAQKFLQERGFEKDAVLMFMVGFAPNAPRALYEHLQSRGFSATEIQEAGLVIHGKSGPLDTFRGRVIWPIHDTFGSVLGFGARQILDEDKGPKYINTGQTPVYNKSKVLYGINLAKANIAKKNEVVVVEGYTDVMACHIAGVDNAVATCGTAFGVEHIRLIRRIMSDDAMRGRVVFNFDADQAGKKAAIRAFAEDHRFVAQTFVAFAKNGLDPCDLRIQEGDTALCDLVKNAKTMYEFIIKEKLSMYNLDQAEGRALALRDAAPIVASIKDRVLMPEYVRLLALWLGMELDVVRREVTAALKQYRADLRTKSSTNTSINPSAKSTAQSLGHTINLASMRKDPIATLEISAISALLQNRIGVSRDILFAFFDSKLLTPTASIIKDAMFILRANLEDNNFIDLLKQELPDIFSQLIAELFVTPLPVLNKENLIPYTESLLLSVIDRDFVQKKADLLSKLRRTDQQSNPEEYTSISEDLALLETKKRQFQQMKEGLGRAVG